MPPSGASPVRCVLCRFTKSHTVHATFRDLPSPSFPPASFPNRESREVYSGHYVTVHPQPLPKPVLVVHSPSMAKLLGLEEASGSDEFAAFFSGDVDVVSDLASVTWCTGYALSIYGEPMMRNCPFGTGNGYGDGRAISVAEIVSQTTGDRWELQLKGAGKTPYSRRADGRAVLRSSVREFLASEAMFHLGVSTTRALSLVASGSETVDRPWYVRTEGPTQNHDEATVRETDW